MTRSGREAPSEIFERTLARLRCRTCRFLRRVRTDLQASLGVHHVLFLRAMYALFMPEPETINESERATIKKSKRGAVALNEITQTTGENMTEAYNRAVVLYALLLRETQAREKDARPGEVIFYLTNPKDPNKTDKVVFV